MLGIQGLELLLLAVLLESRKGWARWEWEVLRNQLRSLNKLLLVLRS